MGHEELIGRTVKDEEGFEYAIVDNRAGYDGSSELVVLRQRYTNDVKAVYFEEFVEKYTEVKEVEPYTKKAPDTFDLILETMKDLHTRKNADYGSSFDRSCDLFGPVAAVVRISDKFNRLVEGVTGSGYKVSDEKFEDTLIDLANYSVMTLAWMRNKKQNLISEEGR